MAVTRKIDLDAVGRRAFRWTSLLDAPDAPSGMMVDRVGEERPSTYATLCVPLVLHVTGKLERFTAEQRERWVETINSLQQPDGGYLHRDALWRSDWYAMCLGCMATNALGGRPRYPYTRLRDLRDPDALRQWLAQRDWHDQWLGSQEAWGACMLMLGAEQTPTEWREALRDWLDAEQDPANGFWRRHIRPADRYQALAGAFHLTALYQMGGWAVPNHEKLIHSVLSLQKRYRATRGLFGSYDRPHYGELHGAATLDWLTTTTGHRRRETIQALSLLGRYVEDYFRRRKSLPFLHDDVHGVLARIRLLAVLQKAIPALFLSECRWRDVWSDAPLYACRY